MTIHIGANKGEIAKIVIMTGDPKKATAFKEKLLTNAKLVSDVRGIPVYTGYYKNKEVTIMASGMGIPSMGIYSYELFNDYDVDYIIRVGTCGSYEKNVKLLSLVLATNSYSESAYAKNFGYDFDNIKSSELLNDAIKKCAKEKNVTIMDGNIHSTETFYNNNYQYFVDKGCIATEMETFSLFTNAYKFNKNAAAILTITDNLITNERLSSIEREKGTFSMFELALDSIINL